jgi:hypothetical protein
MATINDVGTMFLSLSDDEAYNLLKNIRFSRRTPKKPLQPIKVKPKIEKKVKPVKKLSSKKLSSSDAKLLLEILQKGGLT